MTWNPHTLLAGGLWMAGAGLMAYVGYRTKLLQAYLAYWRGASQPNTPDDGISSKRAVFIHAAIFGATMIAMVLAKAGWVFTKESLDAFENYMLMTAGGYVGGGIADALVARFGKKKEPTQ